MHYCLTNASTLLTSGVCGRALLDAVSIVSAVEALPKLVCSIAASSYIEKV